MLGSGRLIVRAIAFNLRDRQFSKLGAGLGSSLQGCHSTFGTFARGPNWLE